MRVISHYDCRPRKHHAANQGLRNDEARRQVANEAAYLYAPLAHKLGLYKLKSELEDLSLKYTEKGRLLPYQGKTE